MKIVVIYGYMMGLYYRYNITGWWYTWYTYPSEKYCNIVSWDDEIPNIWKNKIHVQNHQPVIM